MSADSEQAFRHDTSRLARGVQISCLDECIERASSCSPLDSSCICDFDNQEVIQACVADICTNTIFACHESYSGGGLQTTVIIVTLPTATPTSTSSPVTSSEQTSVTATSTSSISVAPSPASTTLVHTQTISSAEPLNSGLSRTFSSSPATVPPSYNSGPTLPPAATTTVLVSAISNLTSRKSITPVAGGVGGALFFCVVLLTTLLLVRRNRRTSEAAHDGALSPFQLPSHTTSTKILATNEAQSETLLELNGGLTSERDPTSCTTSGIDIDANLPGVPPGRPSPEGTMLPSYSTSPSRSTVFSPISAHNEIRNLSHRLTELVWSYNQHMDTSSPPPAYDSTRSPS